MHPIARRPLLRHLPAPAFVAVKVEVGSSTPSEDWPGFPGADYVVIVSGDYDFDVPLSYRDHERLLKTIRTVHTIAGAVDTRTTMALKRVKCKQCMNLLHSSADRDDS